LARGWESKSVEAQIEAAVPVKRTPGKKRSLTPAQLELIRKRESLEMSRLKVLHDLDQASHPRYQQMLKEALAHLDRQLAQLH
jgi:hypothetical protein